MTIIRPLMFPVTFVILPNSIISLPTSLALGLCISYLIGSALVCLLFAQYSTNAGTLDRNTAAFRFLELETQ